MREKGETGNPFQVWNVRDKEDGDTKEREVRKEKCFDTENEKFDC